MKAPSSSSSAWWTSLSSTTLASLLLLATTSTAAVTAAASGSSVSELACDSLLADGHKYNLQALAGPHVAVTHEYTRPTYHNTTYAINVCGPLVRKGEGREEERCPEGTRGRLFALSFFFIGCID